MATADEQIPVYVLTGFLGSGKTTLLRNIVEDAKKKGLKPAILLNEVGEVNVEGETFGKDVAMAEMLGGCICCSIRSDLGLELAKLAREFRPDVIWIESTGIARPLETIDSVTEASMYEKLTLQGVVAVADCRQLLDRLRIGAGKTFKLMKEQLLVADAVVLNKSDLVGVEELAELKEQVAEWNPSARLIATTRGEADLALLYGDARTSKARMERSEREPGAHGHGSSLHEGIRAVTHYMPGPVDGPSFERFMDELPEGVFRAKGIVTFRETGSRYLFQYAYGQSDYLRINPQGTVLDVAVFIGEDFDRRTLVVGLDKLAVAPVTE